MADMPAIESPRKLKTSDGILVAALCGLLFCVYLLTASLTFVSDDELFLFDTTESFAKHASVRLSETADLDWPGEASVEPGLPFMAAPFYWLANEFSGIGNAHATLLFNAMITALTAGLVYLYIRQLGFGAGTALVGGLAFGLCTLAWPYTKTFFREPAHMATLFATAYALLRFRDAAVERRRSAITWLALTLALAILALFTKESAIYALPLLLLILVPQLRNLLRANINWWLVAGVCLAGLLGLLAVAWIFNNYFVSNRFEIIPRLRGMVENLNVAWPGIYGFIFSPGKSIFVFSPPLILAIVAPFISPREKRWDAIWPLILTLVSILVYALVRGDLWWGGTNWGPRYMLPMTPFLMVAAAPVLNLILDSKKWLPKLGLGILLIVGALVQIGGVSLRLGDYYEWIGNLTPGGAWTVGLWDPYYSAALSHWRLLLTGAYKVDFAWLQALTTGPAWLVPALAVPLIAVFIGTLWYALTRLNTEPLKRRVMFGTILIGFLLTSVVTWLSLHSIYYDQRYNGNNDGLYQMLDALNTSAASAPNPVIFLNNRTYFLFMLNYYKGPFEWYTLGLNPNELLQPGQTRPAPSSDPYDLISTASTGKRIFDVADCFGHIHPTADLICSKREHPTAFLIMEFGPFTPDAIRPMEWWFSRNFFYRGVSEFGPTIRVVEFSTSSQSPAPKKKAAHPTDYRVSDTILLTGWDANPDGVPLRPGTVLNISTRWQAINPPGVDYKIGTYLISPEGAVVAQDDSFPVNGFWPTLTWRAGDIVRHNVGLALPNDLPPGFYEVWTLMYSPADNNRLPVQDASGTTILDHIVLFTVEVTR